MQIKKNLTSFLNKLNIKYDPIFSKKISEYNLDNNIYDNIRVFIYQLFFFTIIWSYTNIQILYNYIINSFYEILFPLVRIIRSVAIVLESKNGSVTMDAIVALYTEVMVLCYLIVFLVLFILKKIEETFSTRYSLEEDNDIEKNYFSEHINILNSKLIKVLFKNRYSNQNNFTNEISEQAHQFNLASVKFSQKGEAVLDLTFLMFPTVVIFYIIIPTLGFLYNKDINLDSLSSIFSIDIIGHQWYWTYAYNIDIFNSNIFGSEKTIFGTSYSNDIIHKIEFDSIIDLEANSNRLLSVDNVLLIPSNTNIRLSFTSTDVIHSWTIPQLGIKVDTIPGRITTCNLETYIESTFYGQCSELCGVNHGFMPIVVESVTDSIFFLWYMSMIDIWESDLFNLKSLLPSSYSRTKTWTWTWITS